MRTAALALVAATVIGLATAAQATAAAEPAQNYRVTSWSGGDGITFGAVRALVQDQDRYIWFASDAGLVRFDGFRFAVTDLVAGPRQLPLAAIRSVYLARDGSVWAGYGNRQGIYRIARGEVRDVFLADEITGFINAMTQDRHGVMWIAHDRGLHRFENNRWEQVVLPHRGAPPGVLDVHEDQAGTTWAAASNGVYRRIPGGGFEQVTTDGPVLGLAEEPSGQMWMTDEVNGFRPIGASTIHAFKARGMSLFHDRADHLWVATTGQGLWELQRQGDASPWQMVRRVTARDGLISDELKGFLQDQDGNLWTGSIQGLSRLTPYKVGGVTDLGVVRTVALSRDGTAWVGTTAGLIAMKGVTRDSSGTRTIVLPAPVRALRSRGDLVWAATDAGLFRIENGHAARVPVRGSRLDRVTSMDVDRWGRLWISDQASGLVRLTPRGVEQVTIDDASGLPPSLVHVDDSGRAWVAFSSGALKRLGVDDRVTTYGVAEGLPEGAVNVMANSRNGHIWVGTTRGLGVFDGHRFRTLTPREGLPDRAVLGITEDDAGDLWVAFAYRGFVRLQREEISRAFSVPGYRLRYRVYNTSDGTTGFPSPPSRGSGARDQHGSLWFVTTRGITILDPARLRNEAAPPPVRALIEGVTADETRYAAATDTMLPPRTSRIRIDYTVVNPSLFDQTAAAGVTPARIRFRYRLDGFDTNWIEGSGPRQAVYMNLGPGQYRFRLQTAGDAAIWEDAETEWPFAIRPMFYETGWFRGLAILAVVLGAVGTWSLRVRHLRKQFALVFAERMRLSREIHDTLLQGMYGVALQVEVAAQHLPPSSPTLPLLQRVQRQIADYIVEARQSLLNLRSAHLEPIDLVEALRETADQLTAGQMPFIINVTGTPRPCSPKVEKQVLRISREAVMNAVRHSGARQIRMDVAFEDRLLHLRVADDGCGFNPADIDGSAHYGLLSMRERATDAGGRCIVESRPGAGVQVVAQFPVLTSDTP